MEKILEDTLLFDFYGELLTENQKRVYEDSVLNDLSLSEIADDMNISRQGVRDTLVKAKTSLASYEKKLGLVTKFTEIQESVGRISGLSDRILEDPENTESIILNINTIKDLTKYISDKL
ncbi:MAG: DNA-binding protein [Lachnospiraceae bacterium]|nr:DNA-binding protein [Lachnospiraceae bacterium]